MPDSPPTRAARGASPVRAPRKTTPDQAATPAATTGVAAPSSDLNTAYLETLLGYNARRAALAVISVFLKRMAPFGLKPVEFSVLTLIAHNPGVTSRQICTALDILPPNLVGIVKSLDQRGLIVRKAHPTDGRAQGLHLSAQGKRLQGQAQATATALESDAAQALTADELDQLKSLLRKVYKN
jgi:DNA-binding MarR family transcriptional regulator